MPDRPTTAVSSADDGAFLVLIRALEMRDPFTHGHSLRVADLAVAMGKVLRWDDDRIAKLRLGARLHDLGNLGVDDQILNKEGRLTAEELTRMQAHTKLGASLVEGIPALEVALPVIHFHHERWDGAGYPKRLLGGEIPIEARIVAIADTFDAMTSSRSYRKAFSHDDAVREIKRQAGYQFDPQLLPIFVESLKLAGQS